MQSLVVASNVTLKRVTGNDAINGAGGTANAKTLWKILIGKYRNTGLIKHKKEHYQIELYLEHKQNYTTLKDLFFEKMYTLITIGISL